MKNISQLPMNSTSSNLIDPGSNLTQPDCNLVSPSTFDTTVLPTLHFLIFVVGVLGNGLVLLVVGRSVLGRNKYGSKASVTNVLVFNLALADLIFVATLPFHAVEKIKVNRFVGNIVIKYFFINFFTLTVAYVKAFSSLS